MRANEQGADERASESRAEGAFERSGARFRDTPAGVNDVARRVLSAAIEVHRHLGAGYLESVYQEALEVELALRGVRFERQVAFRIDYKGHDVGAGRADLVAERCVIVEIKAVDRLHEVHVAQALSYLKGTGLSLALLINFRVPVLLRGVRRVARNEALAPALPVDEPSAAHERDS